MTRKAILLSLATLVQLSATALTLDEAHQMAHDNYPAIRQYRLLEQSRDYTLANVAKAWLPQVGVQAGAYAFTDIVKMNTQMKMAGMSMENWTAGASVTLRQNVYDGGQNSAQKEVATAENDVQKTQTDVTMYAINERIDQLFFGLLLLDDQTTQNSLLQKDLQNSEQTVKSMMKEGIANQTDLDAIRVEQVKADMQREALLSSRKAYLRMLGVFVGRQLPEGEPIVRPSVPTAYGERGTNRPEMQYYTAQNMLIDAQRRQLDTKLRPTVSLFGMGTVHSRVSDLMHNGVLMGGVSLSWNIGALYTRKNDIRQLETKRAMNESQRETFLFHNRLQNEETDGNIASLQRQIAKDEEIVQLRERIRSKADGKVRMGTESINELVRDINAVSMARAQKAQHETELLREIYRLKNINNYE